MLFLCDYHAMLEHAAGTMQTAVSRVWMPSVSQQAAEAHGPGCSATCYWQNHNAPRHTSMLGSTAGQTLEKLQTLSTVQQKAVHASILDHASRDAAAPLHKFHGFHNHHLEIAAICNESSWTADLREWRQAERGPEAEHQLERKVCCPCGLCAPWWRCQGGLHLLPCHPPCLAR